jgi:hypothetical protein
MQVMVRPSQAYRSTLRAVGVDLRAPGRCGCTERIHAAVGKWAGHNPEFLRGLRAAAALVEEDVS